MQKIVYSLIMMTLVFSFSCCKSTKEAKNSNNMPLIGTQWMLVSIENEDINNEYALHPFITFDTNGAISGCLGCNSFFGDYQLLRKQKISIEYKGATKRLCDKMSVEKQFLNALKMDINHYQITGDELVLLADKVEVMKFKGVNLEKVE